MQNNSPSNFNQDHQSAKSWFPRSATNKRLLIITAMGVIGGGMALNWGWLTAIGVAPLIFALAPCAVMCGFGMCAMCKSSGSCSKETPNTNTPN